MSLQTLLFTTADWVHGRRERQEATVVNGIENLLAAWKPLPVAAQASRVPTVFDFVKGSRKLDFILNTFLGACKVAKFLLKSLLKEAIRI
jgi:hypothetical protein